MNTIDFGDKKSLSDLEGTMQEIEKGMRADLNAYLRRILTTEEQVFWDFIENLSFSEGAWYRPSHNQIVTAAGIAMCNQEGFARHNVYSFMSHDAGNSLMKVAPTTKGADWENPDKRFEHAKIGSHMVFGALGILRSQGLVDLDDQTVISLYNAIQRHDFPYVRDILANPEDAVMRTPEEVVLRSADRVFVPSALSFWKDLVAQCSDENYQKKAKEMGFSISPENLIRARLAFWFQKDDELPQGWDTAKYGLDTNLAAYNEGGHVEPPYTATERELLKFMFKNRVEEYDRFRGQSVAVFGQVFEEALEKETKQIIDYAQNKVRIKGPIVHGHGIATQTVGAQAPYFESVGIKSKYLAQGSINVDISPQEWELVDPDIELQNVVWKPDFAEDFGFVKMQVKFEDKFYPALLYNPKRTVNPKTIIEVLSEYIPGVEFGKKIELLLPENKISFR